MSARQLLLPALAPDVPVLLREGAARGLGRPELRPYHPSDFHVAQSGGGAMRRCRQKRRRRRPRVNREIRLRATLLRCVPAVFFQQGFGSTGQPPLLGRETLPSLKRRPELPCEMK